MPKPNINDPTNTCLITCYLDQTNNKHSVKHQANGQGFTIQVEIDPKRKYYSINEN